jgi:predicted TPR repeat methyltransferase
MTGSADATRLLRRLRHSWRGARRDGAGYCIRPDYRSRVRPKYFIDADNAVCWQPDVYPRAAALATRVGATRIVDLGCGNGDRLAALHPRFQIVGVDLGANLEICRTRHPFGRWLEHDLDSDAALPLAADDADGTVFVAADVVEHLRRPERMLARVRAALERAEYLVLSTPERELTWGAHHRGPPPNLAHVREWTQGELRSFLGRCGFTDFTTELTRSNDDENRLATILAVIRR